MTARSELVEKSLSCFRRGLASMIPVAGFFIAPTALLRFRFVVMETNDRWNPARTHLYIGTALALLSLLGHAIAGALIFIGILRAISNG